MKTNKMTKLGVSLLSVVALGVAAPALTDVPVLGVQIVKAEDNQQPANYYVYYKYFPNPEDYTNSVDIAPRKEATIQPGETVFEKPVDVEGYIPRDHTGKGGVYFSYDEATGKHANVFFGTDENGTPFTNFSYDKDPNYVAPQPSEEPKETPKPEEQPQEQPKPEVKPSEEVKPEVKPSEEPKPEVKPTEQPKPETKPSETPKPEVKPSGNQSSQTGSTSTTAPTTPVKPAGQVSNAPADKPVAKTETPAPKVETKPEAKTNNVAKKANGTVNTAALPNTGEQNSVLAVLFGFVALALGLLGFRKKSE